MVWRELLPKYVELSKGSGDVYHFGIWFGGSLSAIANYLAPLNSYRHLGFDSFEGLPLDPNEPLWHPEWHPETGHFNAYSAKTWAETDNMTEAIKKVSGFIKEQTSESFKLIPGYYDVSLKDSLVRDLGLRPAVYIDVDCDIYTSTIECLDFMFRNHLVKTGTVIGFDDWKCTPGWESNESGESRAWKEISEKYGVESIFLYDAYSLPPHLHPLNPWVVKVVSIE